MHQRTRLLLAALCSWCLTAAHAQSYDWSHSFTIFNKTITVNGTVTLGDTEPAADYTSGELFQFDFHCDVHHRVERQELLVKDHKGWSFPRQDTNLTLAYPSDQFPRRAREYVVTSLRMRVTQDAGRCAATVTSGGLAHRHVTAQLVSHRVTRLAYTVEVRGVPADKMAAGEYSMLCE